MKIHGNGSVVMADKGKTRKTCRHWYLRVETDHGRKQKRFSGTYTQAQAELQHFKASLIVPQGEMKFSDLSVKFLEYREKLVKVNELDPETYKKDERRVKRLVGKFGDMRIGDMTEGAISDGLMNIRLSADLSGTYMNGLYTSLGQMLRFAVHRDWLAKDPTLYMKAPKIDTSPRKALSFTVLEKFLNLLWGMGLDSHTVAAWLAVLSGLRRGEIVGLEWRHVDFTALRLYVEQSCTQSRRIKSPKTRSGRRYLPMLKLLAEILREWQKIQEAELAAIGIKQTLDTPVITSGTGTRMHPQNLDRWWRRVRGDLGLEGTVLHELRHTFLTMLGNQDTPLEVLKSIAGWSDISMANTYVHTSDEANAEAMAKLDDLLKGII